MREDFPALRVVMMRAWSRCVLLGLAVTAATLPMAACSRIIPPEGPSKLTQLPNRNFGPSSQRRNDDGYPLLGAFPGAAAPQLDSNAVAAERAGMLSQASAQNNEVRSAAAEYQQSVAEARAIRARHDRDVSAMTSIESERNAARRSNAEVLRQIEEGSGTTTTPQQNGSGTGQ